MEHNYCLYVSLITHSVTETELSSELMRLLFQPISCSETTYILLQAACNPIALYHTVPYKYTYHNTYVCASLFFTSTYVPTYVAKYPEVL